MAQLSTKDFRETTVPGTGHMAQLQFTQRTTDHELLIKGQRTDTLFLCVRTILFLLFFCSWAGWVQGLQAGPVYSLHMLGGGGVLH